MIQSETKATNQDRQSRLWNLSGKAIAARLAFENKGNTYRRFFLAMATRTPTGGHRQMSCYGGVRRGYRVPYKTEGRKATSWSRKPRYDLCLYGCICSTGRRA
jgi:hypothetical protein